MQGRATLQFHSVALVSRRARRVVLTILINFISRARRAHNATVEIISRAGELIIPDRRGGRYFTDSTVSGIDGARATATSGVMGERGVRRIRDATAVNNVHGSVYGSKVQ